MSVRKKNVNRIIQRRKKMSHGENQCKIKTLFWYSVLWRCRNNERKNLEAIHLTQRNSKNLNSKVNGGVLLTSFLEVVPTINVSMLVMRFAVKSLVTVIYAICKFISLLNDAKEVRMILKKINDVEDKPSNN